jgi:D-amino peptidase
LHTVAVKRGLTRYSARNIPPKKARQMIEEGAREALTSPIETRPYVPGKPTAIKVDLGTVDSAKEFMGRHGVEFENPLRIISRGKDWMQAWDQVWHW